tara:strand:+ start:2929 stop:3312 length:384 start_codon:yes stop_codon:yes gene_type:complete
VIHFLKLIFNISVIILLVVSLYPGSLLGLLFYGDLNQQPNLIKNPFGTTINHFISYIYVSLLGFSLHFKGKNFQKLLFGLLFLSIILEVFHLILPNRSFQLGDLIANISGVLVAYSIVKIYSFLKKL